MADLGVFEKGLEGPPVGVGVDATAAAAAAATEAPDAALEEFGLPTLPESSRLHGKREN